MEKYRNIGGDSNVDAYEVGVDFIKVRFNDGSIYLYTYVSAGAHNITQMHALAANGNGLNAFINTHVKKLYARKEG